MFLKLADSAPSLWVLERAGGGAVKENGSDGVAVEELGGSRGALRENEAADGDIKP